ncbi:metal ABC transporter ATP-binding protein [bacterium]|nr:metal ABC transporter ATP-binding protein [bacterium]
MNEEILRFQNVTVCYGDSPAVHHVTATVHCGALTALLGPNGAGKSTLIRTILGWLPLTTGKILIGDDHAHHQLPRIAYLPQRSEVDWSFPVTVRTIVRQGRYPSLGSWRRFRPEDHEMVEAAIVEMGIEDLAERQIQELSGGQQQRVFLARALAQGADIFLLDEPFTGLDPGARDHLMETLAKWPTLDRTVLAVVHDLDLARRGFQSALLLRTHLISAGTIDEVLSPEHVREAYGSSFVEAGT